MIGASLVHAAVVVMTSWHEIKVFIEYSAGFSHDAIHVLVGGIGPLVVAFLIRKTVGSWIPWLVMLVLILFNEGVDLWWQRWPDPAMQYGDGAKDILLTMVLPTVLLVCARLTPYLFVRGARRSVGSRH